MRRHCFGRGKVSDGQGRPDGVPVLQSLPLGLSGIGGGQVCAGSLALPEMLAQFEREADLDDE